MVSVNEERIQNLAYLLTIYSDILSEFGIKDQIMKTFKFEKSLTSIEMQETIKNLFLSFSNLFRSK